MGHAWSNAMHDMGNGSPSTDEGGGYSKGRQSLEQKEEAGATIYAQVHQQLGQSATSNVFDTAQNRYTFMTDRTPEHF